MVFSLVMHFTLDHIVCSILKLTIPWDLRGNLRWDTAT
jgi:hypothetical protein